MIILLTTGIKLTKIIIVSRIIRFIGLNRQFSFKSIDFYGIAKPGISNPFTNEEISIPICFPSKVHELYSGNQIQPASQQNTINVTYGNITFGNVYFNFNCININFK